MLISLAASCSISDKNDRFNLFAVAFLLHSRRMQETDPLAVSRDDGAFWSSGKRGDNTSQLPSRTISANGMAGTDRVSRSKSTESSL